MKKAKIIRRTVIVLLAILAVIYWKPLLHLAAWLLIACWLLRLRPAVVAVPRSAADPFVSTVHIVALMFH